MTDKWDYGENGPRIQAHSLGLPLVHLRVRLDLVYLMFYFDQSVKCGHTSKQARKQFIFTEPFLARKRTMNAYKKPCVLLFRQYLSFNPFRRFRKKFRKVTYTHHRCVRNECTWSSSFFSRILLEGAYLCDIDFYRSESDRSNS